MDIIDKIANFAIDILEDYDIDDNDDLETFLVSDPGYGDFIQHNGSSKICIELVDYDYVIKVPVEKELYEKHSCIYHKAKTVYDNLVCEFADNEYVMDTINKCVKTLRLYGGFYDYDYCAVEYIVSSVVKVLFPYANLMFSTFPIAEKDGKIIYASEKACCPLDEADKEYPTSGYTSDSLNVRNTWITENTINSFYEQLSEKDFLKFFQFIRKSGINDLSDNNIGIDANGNVRLLDYSGFFDWS